MTTYFVETEERNYNSVNSICHFTHIVRRIWNDNSPIIHVWKWAPGGWIEVDWL